MNSKGDTSQSASSGTSPVSTPNEADIGDTNPVTPQPSVADIEKSKDINVDNERLTHASKEDGADTEPNQELQRSTSAGEPVYSTFSRNQKIFIAAMASMASFFSPFTAGIYFPAIGTLADHYHTTASKINLSVTTYMIFQAIAPMFTGNFGDTVGRRPAIVLCFVIYLAANIGLAVQDSYAALLVVRCLQSAGSSGTVALARGVIADVVTPAQRGSYMGFAMTAVALAPAIAPIVGGALADKLGWRSIFWFLVIFSAAFIVPYVLFMPETNRKIVGDGSIRPTKWYHVSLMDVLRRRREQRSGVVAEKPEKKPKPKDKWIAYVKGPWKAVELFFEPDIAVISIYVCIVFGALYCILVSTPIMFAPTYNFSELQVGLCYM